MLADHWQFGGGYTFNRNHDTTGEPLSAYAPHHLLKVWTSVQLPRALSRVTLSGYLNAQSAQPRTQYSYAGDFRDSYAFVDVRTRVQLDDHWQTALSVNNVFDRNYFETSGPNGLWRGPARS